MKENSKTVWSYFNSKTCRWWWKFLQWRRGGASNNKVKSYREISKLCCRVLTKVMGIINDVPVVVTVMIRATSAASQSSTSRARAQPSPQPTLLRQGEILPLKIISHPLLLLKCLLLLHRPCSLHPSTKKQDSDSLYHSFSRSQFGWYFHFAWNWTENAKAMRNTGVLLAACFRHCNKYCARTWVDNQQTWDLFQEVKFISADSDLRWGGITQVCYKEWKSQIPARGEQSHMVGTWNLMSGNMDERRSNCGTTIKINHM